jgi:small GTP-binding protein
MNPDILTIIEDCIASQNTTLDLGNCGLTDLSQCHKLWDCQHIDSLFLGSDYFDGEKKQPSQNHGAANRIGDISPLRRLPNLKNLQINGQEVLKDISVVAELTGLDFLNFSKNQVQDISAVAELKNLKSLTCNDNHIQGIIAIAGLKNLESFSFSNNYVQNITPVAGLYALKKLLFYKNQVQDISAVAKLIALDSIYFGKNYVQDISALKELKNLEVLSFYKNQVQNIDAIAGLIKLRQLIFNKNQVQNISALATTKQLNKVDISSNNIFDISALSELENIEYLDLYNNKITDISPLQYLPKLEDLNLNNNPVKIAINIDKYHIDSKNITVYPKLKKLQINNSNIATNELAKIHALEVLYYCGSFIDENFYLEKDNLQMFSKWQGGYPIWRSWATYNRGEVTNLDFLKSMPNLKRLCLRHHSIADILPLEHLPNLEMLDISHNCIKNITALKYLQKLNLLFIAGNSILDISILGQLRTTTSTILREKEYIDNYGEISYLASLASYEVGTYLEKIPAEIRGENYTKVGEDELLKVDINRPIAGDRAILKYWLDTYVNTPLREAKIVFIGEGAVGKSSLIHKLLGKPFAEGRTEKIEVHSSQSDFYYQITPDAEKEPLKIHFWDFGGQEIMHATHKFFMSHHSVYILVLNGRLNDSNEIDKWLEILQTSIGNAPVILVVNQLDGQECHNLAHIEMKKTLDNITLPVIETSCLSGRGIDTLKNAIQVQLQNFEGFKHQVVPEKYALVRQELEAKAINTPYIDKNTFQEICQRVAREQSTDFDTHSQSILIQQLNSTGIMLNFQEKNRELEDLFIFRPSWIIDGIYKIINSPEIARQHGQTNKETFDSILESINYSSNQERSFILSMMLHFKLAFQKTNINNIQQIFITSLFSPNRPEELQSKWESHQAEANSTTLHYEFKYKLWRNDYITYFLVEAHEALDAQLYWRQGGLLNYPDSVCAFVKAHRQNKTISIKITSPNDKRTALQQIRHALHKVHQLFDAEKLGIEEQVYYEGQALSVNNLNSELADGQTTFRIPELRKSVDIKTILQGLQIDPVRRAYEAINQGDFLEARRIINSLPVSEARLLQQALIKAEETSEMEKLLREIIQNIQTLADEARDFRQFCYRIDDVLKSYTLTNIDYDVITDEKLNGENIHINKLQKETITYLRLAFQLYLSPISDDYSLPIGQFCRALEYELKKRVCDDFPDIQPSQNLRIPNLDKDNPLYNFYKSAVDGNYTLGTITFFLGRLFNDNRIESQDLLVRNWRNYLKDKGFVTNKINHTFIRQADNIRKNYRNPAAHTGNSFSKTEAENFISIFYSFLKHWTTEILN